jgi:hypothetical protein
MSTPAEAHDAQPPRELDATYPEDAPMPDTLTPKAEAPSAALKAEPPAEPEAEAEG